MGLEARASTLAHWRMFPMGRAKRWRVVHLPEKLKQIREALGLSQSELVIALKLDEPIYRNNISSYETGERTPPLPVILAYAKLFGICTDILIDDQSELSEKKRDERGSY